MWAASEGGLCAGLASVSFSPSEVRREFWSCCCRPSRFPSLRCVRITRLSLQTRPGPSRMPQTTPGRGLGSAAAAGGFCSSLRRGRPRTSDFWLRRTALSWAAGRTRQCLRRSVWCLPLRSSPGRGEEIPTKARCRPSSDPCVLYFSDQWEAVWQFTKVYNAKILAWDCEAN